ncbi:MAG TPA: DUF302 domain-containing protein [Chitinivibrionales bacterium]|jgi:uncharacterized protein (DUF302 family)|nr:DUF302 domain-containing protein [Chitinivibrionales bacterium]
MISYGYIKEVDRPFEEVLRQLPKVLESNGFGVVSTIDIGQKLREKLGVEFRKYVILGACSPPNAYKALSVEENIGLMLPCNVIAYEREGKTMVGTIRPSAMMKTIGNPALTEIAEEVEEKLKRVLESI